MGHWVHRHPDSRHRGGGSGSFSTHQDADSDTNIWVQIVHIGVEMRDGIVKQGSREIQCKDGLSKWPMLDSSRMFCRIL